MNSRNKTFPFGSAPRMLLRLAILSAVPAHALAATTPPVQVVDVVLRPGAANAAHDVPFVDVAVTLPNAGIAAGQPLLRLPLVKANAKTAATSLHDLEASDAEGALVLSFHDDPPGGDGYRRWTANRAVRGPVKVSYRADITNAPNPLGAAPPMELRSESWGV